MRGLFIKGMERPEGCERCPFLDNDSCTVTGRTVEWEDGKRPDWVPDRWMFSDCPLIKLEGSFKDKDEATDLMNRLLNGSEMLIYSEGVRDYFREAADMIEKLVLRVEFAEDYIARAAIRLHCANKILQSALAEAPVEE